MSEKQSPFDQLRRVVSEVERLLGEAESAHFLPAQMERAAGAVAIYADNRYTNRPTADVIAAAEMLKERVAAEMRERGERERDTRLEAIVLRVEALRVILPGVAASACIDLGTLARSKFAPAVPA
jgi:hypothetical protein